MSIADNITKIINTLPKDTRLIAVSKTKPVEAIMEAYQTGQRLFGENKVQELVHKWESLPKAVEWHFIGHLQTNKVKYIAPFIATIHSIDSYKLLKVVNEEGIKAGRRINCLLQIHIAKEESKFGFSPEEVYEMLDKNNINELDHVTIAGVMGMATFTDDIGLINEEFSLLRTVFQKLRDRFFINNVLFKEISMGMSDDYPYAIENGSTLIRVGSSIFGNR